MPPDWPGSPRDEARSPKRQRSGSPPTRRTSPRRSPSPQRHRASTAHSRRSSSPRRHHNPPGPRSCRFRTPGRRHARHSRLMSASPPPTSSTMRPVPRAACTHPSHPGPATAAPAPQGATRPTGAVPCPRPPPSTNSTELLVPRTARTHRPPEAPATAAPALPGTATPATAVPCPRLPPRTNSTVLPVPPAVRTNPPPPDPAHIAWWSAPALRDLRRRVKWAGVAGRREGVHMLHTFREIRSRTPATQTRPPRRPSCRRRHGKPFSGTRSRAFAAPTPLKPSAGGSGPPTPRHGPSAPLSAPLPSHHHHTGKGKGKSKGRARDGKGHAGKRARRGPR